MGEAVVVFGGTVDAEGSEATDGTEANGTAAEEGEKAK